MSMSAVTTPGAPPAASHLTAAQISALSYLAFFAAPGEVVHLRHIHRDSRHRRQSPADTMEAVRCLREQGYIWQALAPGKPSPKVAITPEGRAALRAVLDAKRSAGKQRIPEHPRWAATAAAEKQTQEGGPTPSQRRPPMS